MASTSREKKGNAGKAFRVVKPKSGRKHTTPSNKNHRFESFNERIANLKIDPIRRKRHVDGQETTTGETYTYLGQSLEEWRDMNLSRTFTAFAKEVAPLCDNLPVVLYNENTIMDLLVSYIERADALAMEPLLALLSHFAHDLDTRFEKHFQRAVATVTAVAAKHTDLAVVEWSFTSLAWLFKYLSRLLVPDLRPLYDLMAPYLGKQPQRAFVVRFTAEALSFLIRKAAVAYTRDRRPLDTLMEHVMNDFVAIMETATTDLYQQGIMTVLTEATKGVRNDLNSSAVPVLQSLLSVAGTLAKTEDTVSTLTCGVMTSLVHHCTMETFKSIQDTLTAYVRDSLASPQTERISFCCNLLFTVVSVRKGTRVSDWMAVIELAKSLFSACDSFHELEDRAANSFLSLLAVSLQSATVNAVAATHQVRERLHTGKWEPHFLKFCELFSRLGMPRFKELLMPQLRLYVSAQTNGENDALFSLIPRIATHCQDLKLPGNPELFDSMLDNLACLNTREYRTMIRFAELNNKLAASPYLDLNDEQQDRLQRTLVLLVQTALHEGEADAIFQIFALGTCFHYLLQVRGDISDLQHLWPLLCSVSPHMVSINLFWTNLLQYIRTIKPAISQGTHTELLQAALLECVSMPSHTVRQNALDILQELYGLGGNSSPSILATAITIESTPINLDTSRSISMNIRRLAQDYTASSEDIPFTRVVPSFCFGLLHLNLAQAWDDAVNALAAISQSNEGEEVIMSLVQKWLAGSAEDDRDQRPQSVLDIDSDGFKVVTDFECPNFAKLRAICKQVLEEPSSGLPSLLERLTTAQKRISPFTASTRSQALKVLDKIPRLAEKRSRLLVPILLRWARHDSDLEITSAGRWERKDQKAMLAIFAKFSNPKVLYKSADVHEALLSLCANGDVEIQRSALKAILAWKDTVLARYEEHLNNLLDEAKFREEISVFLQDRTDEDEEGILPEDRAQLMPVLLRLLYGRAVAGGKEGQAGRRKAIFVALSRFGEETLRHFMLIALPNAPEDEDNSLSVHFSREPKAPLRQQVGMLNMANDMLQVLGGKLQPFVPILISSILSCTISASQKLDSPEKSADLSLLRDVRQTGMQCLVKIFSHMTEFEPEPYVRPIIQDLIKPRLETFASENTQNVSAMMRLFAAWSARSGTAELFTGEGSDVLGRVAELLRSQHTKSGVQLFVLQDILDSLTNDDIDKSILQPHVSRFVEAIGSVVKQQPPKEVLDASVKSFSRIADRISSGEEAAEVTKICTDLLVKPSKSVSGATKTGLLQTLLPLIERFEVESKDDLYRALCMLFSRLSGADSRRLLSRVLVSLIRNETELLEAARACEDMNAMGTRLDEPDHERRECAFAWVYTHCKALSIQQWLPLVHNCLFYIRDDEDRVNRSSASHALQLFVDTAAASTAPSPWLLLLNDSIVSSIEKGMKESSELVRAEYLAVLGHIVKTFPTWERVVDMQALAMEGSDEASFFLNILHIQQHRRLRALRRLADEATKLSSNNASRLFLPLLEHFVFDQAEGDTGRTLADQTVQTMGVVTKALNRQAFRAAFQRYTSCLKTKPDLEKTTLRLLGVMVDGIEPSDNRVTTAFVNEQLKPLMEYLHLKDESTVDRRMPVAVTIVKLMLALPEAEFASRLPAVLTDVSHVLRSRSQEARDQTRKALTTISQLVGAKYLRFIVQELRSALKRGYQLHVLSYTVHSLLVNASFELGDLDECLPELMLVIMDDIFGITGQEKDAEEYKSGMKEVKSSKSFDTLELLARVTPINRLGELIRPIRALLSEKLEIKMMKKLDELLTRLRKGLDQNPASESRDMLSFCWEVVSQVYADESAKTTADAKVDERVKRYLVQPEAPKNPHLKGTGTSYSFKLVSFALNLLRKVVRRHEDLQTPQNMAGFLPMAGDALLQGQEEVKLSAFRLLSTIMRVSLSKLEADAPLFVKEAVALVKGAPNMTTDAVKAGLELVTSVLREKRSVKVKEKDIATLLKRIKTDLDEPDRQGMIFKFLRAVLGQKIVITEVYEVMDEVGKAMITNPDTSVRESARSAYLQFVMEYPQGKDRWQKQTSFLVGNLQYEHASGRKSVMEFLHQILDKVDDDDIMAEMSPRIFVSLLLVLVGDPDHQCREMAKLLVGKLFERAGDAQMKHFMSMMEVWLRKSKKPSVKCGALQCWSIFMQTQKASRLQLESLRDKLGEVLKEQDDELEIQPQLTLSALETFSVLVKTAPIIGFGQGSAELWETMQTLPASGNADLQVLVAQLVGLLFDDFARANSAAREGLAGLPLCGSAGLELGAEDMCRLCAVNLESLRAISLTTSEDLALQIRHNLVFLGRCFNANGITLDDQQSDGASEDENTARTEANSTSAMAHILRQLSRTVATDTYSIVARTAALQCQTSLLSHLTLPIPVLQTILRPLHALTDPSVPKPPGDLHRALEDKAHEALELIQKKMGSEPYITALGETRNMARKVREERRQKRKIGAVTQPEKWERVKKRKHEAKKGKIKARGEEARGKRRGW